MAQGTLAMYCSSPDTAWCQGMAIGFEKAAGIKVSVTQKATGELFAQIKAEAGAVWSANQAPVPSAVGQGGRPGE